MSGHVQLTPTWQWSCPMCGRVNTAAFTDELTPGQQDKVRTKMGMPKDIAPDFIAALRGGFVDAVLGRERFLPDMVACSGCAREYATETRAGATQQSQEKGT